MCFVRVYMLCLLKGTCMHMSAAAQRHTFYTTSSCVRHSSWTPHAHKHTVFLFNDRYCTPATPHSLLFPWRPRCGAITLVCDSILGCTCREDNLWLSTVLFVFVTLCLVVCVACRCSQLTLFIQCGVIAQRSSCSLSLALIK